jgi:hypothetical protein
MNGQEIFGCSSADVRNYLEHACRDGIRDFSFLFEEWQNVDGMCGEYLLPVFTIITGSGRTLRVPMFVRRQLKPASGKRQAHHYEFLSSQSVSTPALHGSFIDADGREVVFLERIEPVGAADEELLAQSAYLERYLRMMASFNAARPSVDYVGALGRDLAARDWVRHWNVWVPWSVHILARLEAGASQGRLGERAKAYCDRNANGLTMLRRLVATLLDAVLRQPTGLVHGDFRPANTGWREGGRQLALFDFEDVMLDARFYDVGQVLGGPLPLLSGTTTNDDLMLCYLEAYNRLSGSRIAFDNFRREIRIAWAARTANLWEHLPPEVGGPPYDHRAFVDVPEERQQILLDTLAQLIESIPTISDALERAA